MTFRKFFLIVGRKLTLLELLVSGKNLSMLYYDYYDNSLQLLSIHSIINGSRPTKTDSNSDTNGFEAENFLEVI